MPNIRDIKKRINGAKQTLKITMALKLVSGSMLAKVQGRVKGARPYNAELEKTLKTASVFAYDYAHKYLLESSEKKKVALLVMSSERGLCGSYNSMLVRKIHEFINQNKQYDYQIYCIGKKASEIMAKDYTIAKKFTFAKNEPSYAEIEGVANELGAIFERSEVGKVFLAYNHFQSALTFTPTVLQVLPLTSYETHRKEALASKELPPDYKYDVSVEEMLDYLIPELYVSSLFNCQLSALTAEYSTRMWAMENASKNCQDLIKRLTIKMNKMRQGSITKELIEIVSGAETMKAR
ncbi:MAG: ATP synthase F1 subunit gamma [Oligoflexia bacterium]|nr:ATP synthase F1 subunit gamma [Oligoflexia bacterium]MBF0366993.1 ATP synthase F1 subunit gamma [Oligoflexia bacterium]